MYFQQFTDTEIEQQVLAKMRELDIEPYDEHITIDGGLHRYRTKYDKPSETSGAYCIHPDGIPAGFFQDWRTGAKENWRFDTGDCPQDKLDYFKSKEFAEKAKQASIEREKERKEKQARAAEHSRQIWEQLSSAPGDHPYLQKKQIYSYGFKLRKSDNWLAVPLRDIDGVLKSIQWIAPDGMKRFQLEAPNDDVFYSIALDTLKGNPEQTILIGEGVATMCKVYELTGYPCVAAKNCSSLPKICKIIREKYPKNKIIITADDDKTTELKRGDNPGINAAKEVCDKKLADGYVTPPFKSPDDGTDWDDFALKYGDENCERILQQKIANAEIEQRRRKYQAQAQELGIMSGESFASFCQPPKGEDFIIQDWLPTEALTMLFAPSGSGKGFIALDMAFAVACKEIEEWHGKKIIKHGGVVYLAGEGQRGMRKRCACLVAHKDINAQNVDFSIITEAIALDDKQPEYGIKRVIANIGMNCPNPALVIIDTVNCYMSGDENKTSDATAFIRACKSIINTFKCSVMIVHHTGQNPDLQTRARGSSAFKAAMDMEFKITKSGMHLTMAMTKSKDSDIQRPLVFTLKQIVAPNFFDALGFVQTTCVLEYDETASKIAGESQNNPLEKITRSEQFARDTYADAASKLGIITRNEEKYGISDIVAVSEANWRKTFYEQSAADNDETRKKQFQRAKTLLLETKKILFKQIISGEEYYCLKPTGNSYEAEILFNIHQNEK